MLGSHPRRAVVLVCALVIVLAAAPAAALAATQTASAAIVSATFSYQGSVGPEISDEMLMIERSGQTLYSAPVTSKFCTGKIPCDPGSGQSVHVVDLEAGGEPDVVLDLFSGGASCCTVEQVFSFDPGTMTYVKAERNFGQTGDKLEDLSDNGLDEFVSADSSFICEFTSCAASAAPIEILAFSDERFTKVTTEYRSLIVSDAGRWLALFKRNLRSGTGLIAAWAADEDLLGHSARVKSYLAQQLKENHLKAPPFSPSGKKFIPALNKFLRQHGYLH